MCATRSLTPALPRLCCGLAACMLMLALPGCWYGIGVRQASAPPLLAAWRASFFEAGDLSARTEQTLRRFDLLNLHGRQPEEACNRLHTLAVADPQPDLLFALAEVSYHLGCRAEKHRDPEAVAYYYFCAGYAYHYLFDETSQLRRAGCNPWTSAPASAFDPRFRLACDLYNVGLAKCIRAAQRVGRLDPRQRLHLPTPDGKGFTLSIVHHGFQWRPEEFGDLLFCSDYEVVGLDNHFRTYGLGVPLIGIRDPAAVTGPGGAFYPREVSFPVTAFFRFPGTLADLGARRTGRLELYNPLAIQTASARRMPVPLETDLTTPLAYFLSKTDLANVELAGFLRADRVQNRAGLYLFEPYQPGKIPVVLTHGLLSSPLTWTPLFNELQADPELRKHYQFWFYLYPTGNPYLVTAADLRTSLDQLRQELDPQRLDLALEQMVFVGHSMGGLVSKLLTQDSGEDFWRLVSKEPFGAVKGEPATRQELQRIFYFERQPCIKRVVFLGTPHHGSKLSPSWPVRLAAKFVRLPRRLMETARAVIRDNPGLWTGLGDDPDDPSLPTSLDLLTPGAPALELLAQRPAPEGVRYHSVIGVALGDDKNGSDGVVTYASAHIDGAESEIVIPAIHTSVHHHPRAVLEVVRILRQHLREMGR